MSRGAQRRVVAVVGYVLRNLAVAAVPLAIWLGGDYLYVRSGRSQDRLWTEPFVGVLVLGLVPLGFWYVNRRLFGGRSFPVAFGLTAGLVALLSVVWFFIALNIVISFHLAIGGSL